MVCANGKDASPIRYRVVFFSTVTVSAKVLTAKSVFPSPLKSPTAAHDGSDPGSKFAAR
jgi:hypothetical protein